jgi:translation initiation factor 2B subunit (eIF-2B alpha/beta/delta family)
MIPGASKYVDSAFEDLDKVREKHGEEVDKIISETYGELKDVTKAGFSVEAVSRAWDVIQKCFKRISGLAADAAEDILNNHPQLKDKVGGNIEQLKQMGNQYGPEAKEKVEETWQQIQDILKGGIGVGTIGKLQSLIQEKTQEIKKYGDAAWQKGLEQAKPLLDKQPQLKELVEKNKDKLLQGDLGQLWQKLQEAVKSGNVDDVQKFVQEQVDTASKKAGGGGGVEQFLQMIPGGSEVGPKLQQLQELSQKHGQEAEKLMKSAIEDIKKVLQQKVDEGQKLKAKVEADAKK